MADRGRTRSALFGALATAVLLAACGGDDSPAGSADTGSSAGTIVADGPRVLAGIVRDPAPAVDGNVVPSLTNPGEDVVFRAEPGGFLAVYFGFTNCPDVCPTTMADWTVALRRLPDELAGRVHTVMVTVDPERDNEVLTGYVQSFVADAEAAGTLDDTVLAAAAEQFGATYSVTTAADGDIEVTHTGFLYLVDDAGKLVVTWPFGTSSQEMAADVRQLDAAREAAQ
ncbi:MAG TPA: SCO family protein [Ilumatobacteraceae bacterium]|nr:SCO family protein [Ilumatobacteraceae bacterium]